MSPPDVPEQSNCTAIDGLIGPEVLRQFTVTFDYGAMIMLLEKNGRYGRADRWDGTSMWMGQRGEAFRCWT